MINLTYMEPETPHRPFVKGDAVEVLDRNHTVLSQQIVVKATPTKLETDCGRHWTQSGWWIGDDNTWPFPSIRHAATKV